MTPRQMLDLPEVDCPKGGREPCCSYLYWGRRLCSYPPECHLDILTRVFDKIHLARGQKDQENATLAALDRAHAWARRRRL